MDLKKPELLAPAGNMEKMKMALLYGADAVYLGGKAFGLRALGGNFTRDELKEAMEFAHGLGKKVYVTVNVFPHNDDIEALPDYLRYLAEIGTDALLVADLGIFRLCQKVIPDMELHISTQANNTNWATVNAWHELGAKRVVLAREMSLAEVRTIRDKTEADLEMFVHGAMCISYSGRCLLSNYFTGRDANQGACTMQPVLPKPTDWPLTAILLTRIILKSSRNGWTSWKRYHIGPILQVSIITVLIMRIRFMVHLPTFRLLIS